LKEKIESERKKNKRETKKNRDDDAMRRPARHGVFFKMKKRCRREERPYDGKKYKE